MPLTDYPVGRDWRSRVLPLGVFVLVSAGFGLGWFVAQQSELELARAETELSSEHIAVRIEDYIGARLNVIMQVRDHLLENDTPGPEGFSDFEGFERSATASRQRYPEIDAINWVDTTGIIRHVVPREPNLAALGQDISRHRVAAAVLAAAGASQRPHITPPVELYQGGLGIAIYVPFVRQGRLEGFINAAFRLNPLIESCLERGVRNHYYFSVHDDDALVYAYDRDFAAGRAFAATRSVSVGDRTWTLRVYPTPQQLARSAVRGDELVSFIGILAAGLLAYTTRRILLSRRQLAKSRERLRRVVQDTPAMICRYRPDGTLTFVNQAFADQVGRSPGALIGTSLLDTLADEQREGVLRRMAAQGRDSALLTHVRRLETPTGIRWEEWRDRALVDDAGEVREFQSIGIDVTESHIAREALRTSEERFRAIFSAASDGILILDEAGTILEANRGACDICGTAPDGLTSTSVFDLGADREELASAISAARDAASAARVNDAALVQWSAVGRSGRVFWVESSFRATLLGGRRRLVAVVRDVTERKRLESQLRHAQKMDALGTLAGGVAHDFNNILTAIMGHSELVRARTPKDSPAWSSLEGIAEACDRATGVTRSLLTFYRKEAAETSRAELGNVIGETLRMLRPMLPAAIDVQTDLPDGGVWVEVDPTQVQQVLMNLALNARDAMPGGGELKITLADPSTTPGDAGFAVVGVSDTGIGMSEGVRERAVEPFFTTKPREQGTGLGLSVVHGILGDHGGSLEIESRPGRGTRVRIRLPLASADATAGTAPAERPPAARGDGQRVLLVEDDEQVRGLLATTLSRAGYEVIEAADGAAGLSIMQASGHGVDLMVLDIDLPKLSGTSVLRQTRAAGLGTPVLMISGDPTHGLGDAFPDDVRFMQKPFSLPDFAAVASALIADAGPSGGVGDAGAVTAPAGVPRR